MSFHIFVRKLFKILKNNLLLFQDVYDISIKEENMKKLIEGLVPLAKQNLESHGHIATAILCFDKHNHLIAPVLMEIPGDDRAKRAMLLKFGQFCKGQKYSKVAVILDCATRHIATKEEYQHIIENYDTERPTIYPKSMRKEAIVLVGINLNDGKRVMAMQEYSKDDKKKIHYGEYTFSDDAPGLIPDSIIQGYNL